MYKKALTLFVLFLTLAVNSQNIVLLKNFNPKARELKHSLNTTKDSLLLKCEKKIIKVEIFNDDYDRAFVVEGSETKIPLTDIPFGKFEVEATLGDKIILMHIVRYKDIDRLSNSSISDEKEDGIIEKGMMLDENLNAIKSSPKNSIEHILSKGRRKKQIRNKKFFWAVYHINNKLGSSKTMKLVDKETADKMIRKNKLELNSVSGKLNELTIWEVYNTTKFMKHQSSNPGFINSSSSDLFNSIPYYAKENSFKKP